MSPRACGDGFRRTPLRKLARSTISGSTLREQIAELHTLLDAPVVGRPDLRRPDFDEVEGAQDVYYIFRYPSGDKALLIAAWKKTRR